ncbi:uncharacterized protein LOC103313477 [Tribolium castaneum]|uniref:Uncharacterized protein n=1 Tax=Tribolium castaneum TaxID=7070 RepID=D2A497_TRICA|nr:PREDICTED: uncharacterized protein LOC103313477 [Tribolium castaneum]EFA05638.2 hypothetical protein TcasGA2_TC015846 [Tribolium castaneum]|eukprot:XP_008195040.1 PREDICTED: uncharacterized protein LOC103313477 [Tribolium castaneum]
MDSESIKKEVPAEDYILIEDEVKVEETCVQEPPISVIIEERLPVCSMCKCGFQRGTSVKFWHESDLYKCNKCILHSRLSQVFKSKFFAPKRKRGNYPGTKRKKQPMLEDDSSRDSDVVIVESEEETVNSIFVTKVLYVCSVCKVKFERSGKVGLKEASDWSKCNKCILHGRLNSIITPARKRKNQVK